MTLRVESAAAGALLPPDFAGLHAAQGYGQKDEPLWEGAEALLAWEGGSLVARLSLSLAPGLQGLDRPAGVLGHYEALDPAARLALLQTGCARLAALGAGLAVGPMNGSTWRRYRLALPGPAALAFPGEPENQARYAADFEAAGFRILESYESRSVDLSGPGGDAQLPAAVKQRWDGCSRPLDLGRFEEELESIYALSVQAFDHAVLYTPIGKESFLAQYRPLKTLYDPDLVRLVEDGHGALRGYMVSYPHQGRVVLKTLACRPDSRGSGLAPWLICEAERIGRAKGCGLAIHALMHEDNRSASISRRWTQPWRRYALYAKDLRP
ncbi:MAG TPA: hypothetical protein VNZ67_13810 [bacterium]|nr:hypothetical protein [bacterium]